MIIVLKEIPPSSLDGKITGRMPAYFRFVCLVHLHHRHVFRFSARIVDSPRFPCSPKTERFTHSIKPFKCHVLLQMRENVWTHLSRQKQKSLFKLLHLTHPVYYRSTDLPSPPAKSSGTSVVPSIFTGAELHLRVCRPL